MSSISHANPFILSCFEGSLKASLVAREAPDGMPHDSKSHEIGNSVNAPGAAFSSTEAP
jgi:hypothetical protein